MAFRIAIPCLKLTAHRNLAKNRLSTIRHKVSTIEHTIVCIVENFPANGASRKKLSSAVFKIKKKRKKPPSKANNQTKMASNQLQRVSTASRSPIEFSAKRPKLPSFCDFFVRPFNSSGWRRLGSPWISRIYLLQDHLETSDCDGQRAEPDVLGVLCAEYLKERLSPTTFYNPKDIRPTKSLDIDRHQKQQPTKIYKQTKRDSAHMSVLPFVNAYR